MRGGDDEAVKIMVYKTHALTDTLGNYMVFPKLSDEQLCNLNFSQNKQV